MSDLPGRARSSLSASRSSPDRRSPRRADLGIFEANGDVGAVGRKGSVAYDAKAGTYTVTGGGENMWFSTDAFHFVWKKASGDVALAADIRFVGEGGNAHRKAALLIRQGLEPDAAYADAVAPRGRAHLDPVPGGARGARRARSSRT